MICKSCVFSQEILSLIELYINGGSVITRGLQQQDVTKRAADEARKSHKAATLQHLAVLLRRQATESSADFGRGQSLRLLRDVLQSPSRIYGTTQSLAKLIEAAEVLRRPIQALPEARSCTAAAAGGGAEGNGRPVEYLNTRVAKRVKREPADTICLSPLNRPPTPGDEGVFSEEETDVEETGEDSAEGEQSNFLDGLLSPENPPEL